MLTWEGVPGVRIEGVLGRGASCVVYLGTQERFGRKVAVKVLHPTLDQAREKLFRTECSTLGRFASHPNILTLFDAGFLDDGSPYLVTEYLPAGTLADRLAAHGPMPWAEVVGVGVQLAGALESTHREGVVHGDIKPQNILLGRMGQPVLGDFGIAHVSAGSSASSMTAVTPLYAAPELFDLGNPSPSTDLYALGASLFELVDGAPAMGDSGDSPLVVVRRIANGERRALRQRLAPQTFCDLIERSMDVRPECRPRSASDFGEALRELERREGLDQTPMPVMAPIEDDPDVIDLTGRVPLPSEVTLGVPSPPWRSWVLAAGAVVLCAAVLVAWLLPRSDGDGEARAGPKSSSSAVASTSVAPSTTVGSSASDSLPSSNIAGIQPGVQVVEGGEDLSPTLAGALDEESLIFQSLGERATEIVPMPYYGAVLSELPALFHYQGFNRFSPEHCRGMMTHRLRVDGLWERGAVWPGARVQVAVGRLGSEEEAHELFTALSLAVGVKKSGCDNMAGFGPASFEDHYQVVQRDILLHDHLRPSVTYNDWLATGASVDGVPYAQMIRTVVEQGPYVVDVAVFDDGSLPVAQEEVAGSVVTQVLERL
jgi:serine/threonine protein kinase